MTTIPATLEALSIPIDSVMPYPRNPWHGDPQEIARSLRKLGQYRPIVVNKRTSQVLAGNHTREGALALGWTEIAATFVDVDEETARRINVVDNRAPQLGAGWDQPALAEILTELPDLEGTGFSPQDLDELLAASGQTPGKETEPKPRPKKPKARAGDVYELGDHRLICGDATDAAAVQRLLGREHPTLVYTDPPYGISYQAFDRKFDVLEGDDLRGEDLRTLVTDSLALAGRHLQVGAATYVWCTWRTYGEFVQALGAAGLQPSSCIVWKKGRVGPGSGHYRPEHEFCLLCRPELEGDHELCLYCKGETWDGGRGQSDVWEVSRDTGYVHPTQKPVALAERALENSTRGGDLVLDMFGGSGSTMLACENLNRRARLVELDPAYVDVIVDRWQRHTGRSAERKRPKK